MYIYQIGYYDYDEGSSVELQHDLKFSKEEIEKIIVEYALNILLNERKRCKWLFDGIDEGDISDADWIEERLEKNPELLTDRECKDVEEFIEKYGHRYYTRYSDIYSLIVKDMIKNDGFKKVVYQEKIFVGSGEGIVDKERESEMHDYEILDKIREEYWKIKDGDN